VLIGFWWGDLWEGRHLEDLDIDGNIILDLQEVGWGGTDWIALAGDRDRNWALVNSGMNLRAS